MKKKITQKSVLHRNLVIERKIKIFFILSAFLDIYLTEN